MLKRKEGAEAPLRKGRCAHGCFIHMLLADTASGMHAEKLLGCSMEISFIKVLLLFRQSLLRKVHPYSVKVSTERLQLLCQSPRLTKSAVIRQSPLRKQEPF